MTKEEAINDLNKFRGNDPCYREAIKMAIEALKQPEIVRCKDCLHYGKPECGYAKGDCRFHTAWYPVDENDYCSKAQRRTNTV